MQRKDFFYHLPETLIAREPAVERRGSRLLVVDGDHLTVEHQHFPDLISRIEPGDLMVFNDTRVIPARLFGKKASGGHVEILIERLLDAQRVLAHTRASKSPKPGSYIELDDGTRVTVLARHDALFELRFDGTATALEVLERVGHMPLPPYIDRPDEDADRERYQTVYGKHKGAVAAPTAGLHFDEALLSDLKGKGVQIAFVTLHVGAGTFQPVRADNLEDHAMHSEVMDVSAEVCDVIRATRAAGKRVIAVGTTSVRCLESAAQFSEAAGAPVGELLPYQGETSIFIYPGYRFRVIDALVTNFHLPESTLLMLVSAFCGYQLAMHAYAVAVEQHYRFFSYGDAMFITKNEAAYQDIP